MNEKEIKIGEKYLLPVTVTEISSNGWIEVKTFGDYGYRLAPLEIKTLLQNGIKNTEATTKYDPYREFRKGDKVKAVLRYGRIPNDGVPKDVILEVIADERDGIVKVLHKMGMILEIFNVYALYLELVTPVEELEPYFVQDFKGGYGVFHTRLQPEAEVCHYFNDMHPYAKEAAKAECARLNAEYRKEQSND